MTTCLNPETNLFDALMSREDLFDRLIALEPRLAKFHRVLVNEHTWRRLTLADTAAMLGIDCRDMVDLANGREIDILNPAADVPEDRQDSDDTSPIETVDTRVFFEAGDEPLFTILDAADRTPLNAGFAVLAPFDPRPLRRLMGRRGYATRTQRNGQVWQVIFMKQT